MAARTLRPRHQEEVKEKIKASQLINRIQDHALEGVEMSATQLRGAMYLLDKLISNAPTVVDNQQSISETSDDELDARITKYVERVREKGAVGANDGEGTPGEAA